MNSYFQTSLYADKFSWTGGRGTLDIHTITNSSSKVTHKTIRCNLYIYNEEMFFLCLFVNHVKTTEGMNMGIRQNDAKSFEDGYKLHFILFHIPFLILFLINYHPYIFLSIKTCKYEYSHCYGNFCSFLKKINTLFIYLFIYLFYV